jgi:hypothetical protein
VDLYIKKFTKDDPLGDIQVETMTFLMYMGVPAEAVIRVMIEIDRMQLAGEMPERFNNELERERFLLTLLGGVKKV